MSEAMDKQYEGAFLDALDLPEDILVPVEIESLAEPGSEKDAAGKLIKQAIMGFKGKTKRLIVNKTNFKNCKAMFGRDHREWIGKTIAIQRRYLDAKHAFGIENTMCVRIIPPVGTPILRSAAQFMGQSHPYGDVPKQQTKPKPAPVQNPELDTWLAGIEPLQSLATCREFRETMLPDCPEHLRAAVESALARREAEVGEPIPSTTRI